MSDNGNTVVTIINDNYHKSCLNTKLTNKIQMFMETEQADLG